MKSSFHDAFPRSADQRGSFHPVLGIAGHRRGIHRKKVHSSSLVCTWGSANRIVRSACSMRLQIVGVLYILGLQRNQDRALRMFDEGSKMLRPTIRVDEIGFLVHCPRPGGEEYSWLTPFLTP
jgi:hypothetical protein